MPEPAQAANLQEETEVAEETSTTQEQEWEKVMGSSVEDHNFTNIITSDGNCVLAGFSIVGSLWDATLIKTETTGSVIWAKVMVVVREREYIHLLKLLMVIS